MKINPTYFKWGVIGVVCILFLILLFGVFRSFRNKELSTHDEVIKAKDQTIEAIKESRKAYELVITEKEKTIAELQRRDSALNQAYLNNQANYIRINERLKNIPAYIASIANNDDSIRAAYRRYGDHTP